MSIIITLSNTAAKLHNADKRAVSVVSDRLAYDVEGAEFRPGYRMGMWNGQKTFLRFPDLLFEAGFVPIVKEALNGAGYPVTLHDLRKPIEIKADDIELDGIELYDFQLAAVAELEKEKRGIIQVATGGGKTEIAIAATKRFGLKTLFLTHKLDLVRQTRRRYQERMGRSVGMISEGEWLPADITVATVQTILAHWKMRFSARALMRDGSTETLSVMAESERLAKRTVQAQDEVVRVLDMTLVRDDRQKVQDFLNTVEFLITDEAHRASSATFFRIISACANAYYRASLTATPLMKGNREDDLKLIATSGNVIHRVTNNDLIERGILARPYFRFSQVPEFTNPETGRTCKTMRYQTAYKVGIVMNDVRNKMVVEDTIELVEEGRKTVVLVKEIKHGDILSGMLSEAGVRHMWVAGMDKPDVREAALKALSDNEIDVLIASTILDEGLDCPAISGIVLAGGGRSKISLFQRVGRSVRAKKGDDLTKLGNTAKIRDYIDQGNKYLMKHSAERYKAVKDEEGWVMESILLWTERPANQKRAA